MRAKRCRLQASTHALSSRRNSYRRKALIDDELLRGSLSPEMPDTSAAIAHNTTYSGGTACRLKCGWLDGQARFGIDTKLRRNCHTPVTGTCFNSACFDRASIIVTPNKPMRSVLASHLSIVDTKADSNAGSHRLSSNAHERDYHQYRFLAG